MASEVALDYAETLSRLIGQQGRDVVVSFSTRDNKAFSFFSSRMIRGHDANSPELLDHDHESIELEFSNGATLTIDPTLFVSSAWNDSGILRIDLSSVVISLIFASTGEDE